MKWYRRVTSKSDGDLDALAEALIWFDLEYEQARKELSVKGKAVDIQMRLPGLVEYYYGIFMEVEGILKWLQIQSERQLGKARRHYVEHYNRNLNASQVEKWAETDEQVMDMRLLCNEVALMRNKYAGLTKGFEYLHFQLGNFTKLKAAGVEDAEI